MPNITIHFHTKDGEEIKVGKSSEKIAKEFESHKLIDYLILTDKATAGQKTDLPIRAFNKIKSYLSTKKDNLLFGLEFVFNYYHLLGLDMDISKWENKKCPTNLDEICFEIEDTCGVIAVPHPFGPSGIGEKGIKYICELHRQHYIKHKPLVEVSFYQECFPSFNRSKLRSVNIKAIEFAKKNNLAIFAGLDTRFTSFDLAYNKLDKEPQKALRETRDFYNSTLIPYITLSHVPLVRESLYLIRDNGISFFKERKSSLLEYLLSKFYR